MRFLPLLLTCAVLPLAAFAQGTDPAPAADPAASLVWPSVEAEDDIHVPTMGGLPALARESRDPVEPAPQEPAADTAGGPQGAFESPAIWGGEGLDQCMVRPWIDAFGDCLASLGAGEEAVRFADALKADPAIATGGVMRVFFETGDVDVALVDFPARANSNRQVVFLNGDTPLVMAESFEAAPPQTRAVAALVAAHPAAMTAGPREYLTHRPMPDGTQRFVLTDKVTDGCRACPVLAQEVLFADFKAGELVDVMVAAWLPPELDKDALSQGIAQGDLTALQTQLILRGYDVGGADGMMGPMTLTAQSDFLNEHCLEGEAGETLSVAARTVLVEGAVGRCPTH